MTLKTKSGLALILLGIAIMGLWSWWKGTRNFVPVNAPIALGPGQGSTAEFQLNFDALYLIEIEAQKSLPQDALRCAMGFQSEPATCKDAFSPLAVNWVLSSAGRPITTGASKDSPEVFEEAGTLVRVIGQFQGKAGQRYTLYVNSLSDTGPLSSANPRLKVAVANIAYTDLQSAGVLVFSAAFVCELFGMVLLGIAIHAARKAGGRPADYRE